MTTDKKTLDDLFTEREKRLEIISDSKKQIEAAEAYYYNLREKLGLAAMPYVLEILSNRSWMVYGKIKEELVKKDCRFKELEIRGIISTLNLKNKIYVRFVEGFEEYRLNEEKND